MAPSATGTQWSKEYENLRRDKLFRNPPKDHTAYPALQEAVNPHIESFNAIFPSRGRTGLLEHGLADIGTKIYLDGDSSTPLKDRNRLSLRIVSVTLQKPQVSGNKVLGNARILPAECRERHISYRGKLSATFEYAINDGETVEFSRELGLVPVMIKSNRCHLENCTPKQLVDCKEESEELGGYFIVNGIEKLVRLLQMNRRNTPLAVNRPSFANRGPGYTPHGIVFRAVRPDETSQTNVLHYLSDGNIMFRFSWRKSEYVVPVLMILKALVDTNDCEIFEGVIGSQGSEATENIFLTDRVELLLRTYKSYEVYSKSETRAFLGSKFRGVLGVSDLLSDYEVGTVFLAKIALVHLGNVNVTPYQDQEKFRLVLFMMRKLYALADGECAADNPDAVQNQEILLGGFLYGQIIKEKLDEFLGVKVREALRGHFRRHPNTGFISEQFRKAFPTTIFRTANENIGQALEYFLSTGNLLSPSGLDLQQASGFTVLAEKLNFWRFISHFRMVHRGAFFAELKTTAIRKLLPESWGFLCPVHTPDGAPCGLLNHFAHKCKIITEPVDVSTIPMLVTELGTVPASTASMAQRFVVMLDGKILGYCDEEESRQMAVYLRHCKVQGAHGVPLHLEIGFVPRSNGGSYPGLYMASSPSRMMRPVTYLRLQKEDYVGSFEQPYMSIAIEPSEVRPGQSTHVEISPTNMLSILANMTPFSNFNQSPRNMYQCQMGKQSMGTPGAALRFRSDNKLYVLAAGQTPIVRSPLHNTYGLDNFPNGTNAVVAVLSYTGYDMDDAMIINKFSHERGFGNGSVYKTKKITLKDDSRIGTIKGMTKAFGFAPHGNVDSSYYEMLDRDGLPHIGRKIEDGDILCAWHTVSTDYNGQLFNPDGVTHYERYREMETCYIDHVRLIGADTGTEPLQTISIRFRVPRSPIIGDKFSSRHGQKGVLSQRYPAEDLPFTESGIQPDVIINPHAFPSRMTIGMFVESLAGKAGALHGLAQDSTPFQFDEEHTAGDYFGQQLLAAGFNFHGNEPMYSGVTGEELGADIYIGVVYYQRLRHMVNDKFQVRTTGPVVQTTGQPVQGRKRAGGSRVGEMERDALLGHGTAFLLQDRLLNCSDYTCTWICRRCGSLLSVQPPVALLAATRKRTATSARCRRCAVRVDERDGTNMMDLHGELWDDGLGGTWAGGADTTQIVIPGALRFLDVELAAMGIKLKYRVSRGDEPRRGKLRPIAPPPDPVPLVRVGKGDDDEQEGGMTSKNGR